MTDQERPNTQDGFQVEDPVAVFAAFSREELRRWRDTEPAFDAALHEEAVALVLERLRKRSGNREQQGRGAS
ncbi:MAG: hypothetical protein H7837_04635 [Magnetococcus sp. MYC-9]